MTLRCHTLRAGLQFTRIGVCFFLRWCLGAVKCHEGYSCRFLNNLFCFVFIETRTNREECCYSPRICMHLSLNRLYLDLPPFFLRLWIATFLDFEGRFFFKEPALAAYFLFFFRQGGLENTTFLMVLLPDLKQIYRNCS